MFYSSRINFYTTRKSSQNLNHTQANFHYLPKSCIYKLNLRIRSRPARPQAASLSPIRKKRAAGEKFVEFFLVIV
jgi:hypothetical protein